MALGDERVKLGKEPVLLLVVSDYAGRVYVSGNLIEDSEVRMVLLLNAIADLLDQIGIDLSGLERKDHVIGHRIVLECAMRHPVHDKLLIEHRGLHPDVLPIEVLDRIELLSEGRGDKDCSQRCDCDQLLHHSSTHLKRIVMICS